MVSASVRRRIRSTQIRPSIRACAGADNKLRRCLECPDVLCHPTLARFPCYAHFLKSQAHRPGLAFVTDCDTILVVFFALKGSAWSRGGRRGRCAPPLNARIVLKAVRSSLLACGRIAAKRPGPMIQRVIFICRGF
jgi:hypothetical protein